MIAHQGKFGMRAVRPNRSIHGIRVYTHVINDSRLKGHSGFGKLEQ